MGKRTDPTIRATIYNAVQSADLIKTRQLLTNYVGKFVPDMLGVDAAIDQIERCAQMAALADYHDRTIIPRHHEQLKQLRSGLKPIAKAIAALQAPETDPDHHWPSAFDEFFLNSPELFPVRDLKDSIIRLKIEVAKAQRILNSATLKSRTGDVFLSHLVGTMTAQWSEFGGEHPTKSSRGRAALARLIGEVLDDLGLRFLSPSGTADEDDTWISDRLRDQDGRLGIEGRESTA
jgi:hypothetical protein